MKSESVEITIHTDRFVKFFDDHLIWYLSRNLGETRLKPIKNEKGKTKSAIIMFSENIDHDSALSFTEKFFENYDKGSSHKIDIKSADVPNTASGVLLKKSVVRVYVTEAHSVKERIYHYHGSS